MSAQEQRIDEELEAINGVEKTLLEYVVAYLCEEVERQPRSLQAKPWFAEAMTKAAIEAYEGGAR